MKKRIPKFSNPEETALFWESHEVLDYVEPDEFKVVRPGNIQRYSFTNPRKKEKKELISLRVESGLLDQAKTVASRRGIGYQLVLRSWLEKGALRH